MIDERAIIDPSAKIASNVTIGPWTVIGPEVEIGEDSWIGPHVIIKSHTKIGKNNRIYQYSSIGEDPQHMAYHGEQTWMEIGDNNIIREFCTLHRGTPQGKKVTRLGNNNFIMSYVHIAHDCAVGNHTIFVNNASIAGHVMVDDYVVIGGFSGVHQFCYVGAHSFITRATMVPKDVLPYVLVSGNPATVHGLNAVGLKRRGFAEETIRMLRQAYKLIYRQGLTVKNALPQLEALLPSCPEVQLLINGLTESNRGIVR